MPTSVKKFTTQTFFKSLIIAIILVTALGGFVPFKIVFAQTAPPSAAERAQLEQELAELEAQIEKYEDTRASYEKEGTTLKSEIDRLNKQIDSANLKIKALNVSLAKLNREIEENKTNITTTEGKIALNRQAMMDALQSVYENENVSLVTVLLKNPNLSDFFNDVNNLLDLQTSLTATVQQTTILKQELLEEQEELAEKRSDAIELKAYQDAQRAAVAATKSQKDQVLAVTKGQEAAYQKLVAEKRATAAKIRNRIFALIGGGEMTFEQAYEFAKFAETATGVPSALLLAVLDRESRLGKNVGRCSYTTAMAPGPPKSTRDDVTPFLKITAELGLDPEKTLVSCPITSDGSYGGAMGPSQFIPTTWMLYRDRVAAVTGSSPASPWRNSDAFVATALYLKDAMGACSAYSGDSQIRCAAARYYAGGNWRRHLYTYGSGTLTRMKQFIDDIAVLNA